MRATTDSGHMYVILAIVGRVSASSIVQRLVRLREQAGLTQVEVASLLGTSQPVIARLEAGGRDPRLSTLQRYARVVGAELEVTPLPGPALGAAGHLTGRIRTRLAESAPMPVIFREVVQFLDDTRDQPPESLAATISVEPLSTGERRWDAVVAGAVDWVASTRGIESPRWVTGARWKLPAPGWVLTPHERLHPMVRSSTPAEFARHGVYVDSSSLESV